MTPHRYPDASAGAKDPVDLGDRVGCGAPDPPETGDNVERRRVPRQGVHIAHPDVAVRVPVPGHRHQPGRGVDTGAGSAAQASQLEGEPGPASHVEQPVPGIDAEPMVHSDVLPAVARLAEGREIHHLTAPALVHQRPRRRVCARPRHCRLLCVARSPAALLSVRRAGRQGARMSAGGMTRRARTAWRAPAQVGRTGVPVEVPVCGHGLFLGKLGQVSRAPKWRTCARVAPSLLD